MTLSISKILSMTPFYTKIKDEIMPIKVAYKMSQLFTNLEKQTQFYNTELNKIISEYSEKDENGNPIPTENGGIKLKVKTSAEAQQKIHELWELEVEVPDIKFNCNELEQLQLTLDEFNLFLPFVEE